MWLMWAVSLANYFKATLTLPSLYQFALESSKLHSSAVLSSIIAIISHIIPVIGEEYSQHKFQFVFSTLTYDIWFTQLGAGRVYVYVTLCVFGLWQIDVSLILRKYILAYVCKQHSYMSYSYKVNSWVWAQRIFMNEFPSSFSSFENTRRHKM